ncbi:MAG: anhydro-N-acetylmuramic acid kinase [Elusimicrobia bacterium RIFOXYA12_FULL_51_18]|nr:MAG: anhydro-N-acetylmuramic acid kinase [Elusimicrobia bacterium RIFOXYA12_FULL_51_18]OGS29196.1 MAG: anhydro-N-acetylmuramic acid kinase [Elusimicrobia bacterium RIFOXYA2_FULL_53_38]
MKKSETFKIMGLMSGTSADGLSIAFCALKPAERRIKVIAYKTYSYGAGLQGRILSAKRMKTPELSALNFELGRLWAGMVRRFCREYRIAYDNIEVIGSHGQTVYHQPGIKGSTLQIGEASFISEETGRPVVSDFRPADMAAGGCGAPLIPFMDEYLFGGGGPVALQNIGGVGNIAFVGKGVRTSGFDTGPGNSLMDTAVSTLTGGKMTYDAGGRWAAAGKIDYAKVEKLLRLPFFALKPPKSLDRDEFSAGFIQKCFGRLNERNQYDALATLNYFTAAAISLAFKKFAPKKTCELIVSGGGALNPVLMLNIAAAMPEVAVKSIVELGIDPLAKEPACFAILAWLALNGSINHCPAATGARGPRVLGKIVAYSRLSGRP